MTNPIEVKLIDSVHQFHEIPVPVNKWETINYDLSGSDDEKYTSVGIQKKDWLSEEEVQATDVDSE